jgi:hypothetical protein
MRQDRRDAIDIVPRSVPGGVEPWRAVQCIYLKARVVGQRK